MARKPARSVSWNARAHALEAVSAPRRGAARARPTSTGRSRIRVRSGSKSPTATRVQRLDAGAIASRGRSPDRPGRIGEAVADHPGAALERRPDRAHEMIARARRRCSSASVAASQRVGGRPRPAACGSSRRPASRRARAWSTTSLPLAAQAAARRRDLGRLAGALAAFERDERGRRPWPSRQSQPNRQCLSTPTARPQVPSRAARRRRRPADTRQRARRVAAETIELADRLALRDRRRGSARRTGTVTCTSGVLPARQGGGEVALRRPAAPSRCRRARHRRRPPCRRLRERRTLSMYSRKAHSSSRAGSRWRAPASRQPVDHQDDAPAVAHRRAGRP